MNRVETEVRTSGASSHWSGEAPDDLVVERVRAGETALYEVLMHRHNLRLRRMARRVLSNEADVEEVIQEAHFNAVRFIWQFSGKSSFATWLTRIAIHGALSRRRRQAHLQELSADFSVHEPRGAVVSQQRDPEQQLQDKEAREALEAAVRALPESYRAVFLLRAVKELSTAEVAVLLEISEGCARTRLHRAKTLLRNHLRARWTELSPVGAPISISSFT